MSIHIGSATLEYAAFHIDRDAPVVIGSDVRTRTGDMVMIRVANPSQKNRTAKVKIDWAPWSVWRKLYAMWRAGGLYSASFDNETSYSVRFAAQNGVVLPQHVDSGEEIVHSVVENTYSDAFNGEVNLIICS